MPLWLASLLFYLWIIGLCSLLRLCTRWMGEESSWLLREFAATLQICVPMFDVDNILDEYGLPGVFIQILFLEWVHWETALRESEGSPLCLVSEEFVSSAAEVGSLGWFFGAQVLAGASAFLFAFSFWILGLHPAHDAAYAAPDVRPCTVDLNIWWLWGLLLEGAGAFVYRLTELRVSGWSNYHVASFVNSLVVASATALGVRYTGMYCNPIEAMACIFNCAGLSWGGHFAVYWVGPFLGHYIAQLHVSPAPPPTPPIHTLPLTPN